MPTEKINSIDDYERFLEATIETWSPDQRTAFAAAMAERWLPAYEVFSKVEQWGDPANLRHMLDAVWGHLAGRRLSPKDVDRYTAQLHDSTPHMDDFDANQALAAAVTVGEALRCCARRENASDVVQAALSGFEAVLPDWEMEIDSQPRLWKMNVVRKELRKQLWLVERIGTIARFNDSTIQALREDLSKPDYAGDILPYPAPDTATVSPGITNQAAFEMYRRMIEADLRSQPYDLGDDPALKITLTIGEWFGRYSRRRQTIDGSYGRLADTVGMQSLLARSRAQDSAVVEIPAWDSETRFWFDVFFQNPHNGIDAKALEEPHSFGPSIRRLWVEAKQAGLPDSQAYQRIKDWARHRPAVWETEDRRKKKGLAHSAPVLGKSLAQAVEWSSTGDVYEPWTAQVNGQNWRVRLGDFPDDYVYYLAINGETTGGFHDWPETWRRD